MATSAQIEAHLGTSSDLFEQVALTLFDVFILETIDMHQSRVSFQVFCLKVTNNLTHTGRQNWGLG